LGAVPQTTLGYERLFNWALAASDEDAFVNAVLSGQPEPPRYFAEMKRVNRDGPGLLGGFRAPPALPAGQLGSTGALLVDTRPWPQYRAGHVAGSLNIPLNRSFTTNAGSLLPYDRDLHLLVVSPGSASAAAGAARDLALIGLDRVSGYFDGAAFAHYRATGGLARLADVDVPAAVRLMETGEALVLDVRTRSEWDEARLADGAAGRVWHVSLSELPERIGDLPRDRPLLVYSRSGSRSALAASLLARHGLQHVLNLRGGLDAWRASGGPIEGRSGR
jgi:hydroxyacylglutathione hydrolase